MTDIDVDRLLQHLVRIVRPRPSGSAELESLRQYVADQLASFGWTVRRHEFETVSDIGETLTGIQLIATLPSTSPRNESWLCIAAHLDSRPETPGADDTRPASPDCWRSLAAGPIGGRPTVPKSNSSSPISKSTACWAERNTRGYGSLGQSG